MGAGKIDLRGPVKTLSEKGSYELGQSIDGGFYIR